MMKKFLSVLVLLAAFTTLTFAQTPAKVTKATDEVKEETVSGPKMVFESKVLDYGSIAQNSDPYRFFKFKNEGTEPLVITYAKGSCGCTVPTWPKEPVPPGGEGEIKIRYSTSRVGPFNKRVTLTTNVGDEKIMLTVKGNVLKPKPEPEAVPTGDQNMFNNN